MLILQAARLVVLLVLPSAFSYSSRYCNETELVNCYEEKRQDVRLHDGLALPVGEAINIFRRYGFLSYSIHIAPLQANDTRLFKESTVAVLKGNEYHLDVKRNTRASMERHMQLHLCDSVDMLLASFLQKFTVEGLQKPWKAFTASWRRQLLPRMLGIPAAYLTNDYRYLLVRIEKRSVSGSIGGRVVLEDSLLEEIASMTDGSLGNAVDFFLHHGTHIVQRYTSGDALYQVLVYEVDNFQLLRYKLHNFDIGNATRATLTNLFTSYPVHVGKLQLASGNRTFVQWLESRLAVSTLPKTLPSSIRLMAAPALLNHVYQQLQEGAVLGMDLVALTRAIPDSQKGMWLSDVLYNLLRVWEMNL